MFLSVTAGAGFPVLHIALGDGGVIIPGAGVAAGTIQTVVRTSVRTELLSGATGICIIGVLFFAGAFGVLFTRGIFIAAGRTYAVIGRGTGCISRRIGAVFKIGAVVRAGVSGNFAGLAGGFVITFFFATFGIVEIIIILIAVIGLVATWCAVAVIVVSIVTGKLIAGAVIGVGDETNRGELDVRGIVKLSPTPP